MSVSLTAADAADSYLIPKVSGALRASSMMIAISATDRFLTRSVSFLVARPQFCSEKANAIVLSFPECSFTLRGVLGVVTLPSKALINLSVTYPCETKRSARWSYEI